MYGERGGITLSVFNTPYYLLARPLSAYTFSSQITQVDSPSGMPLDLQSTPWTGQYRLPTAFKDNFSMHSLASPFFSFQINHSA